MKETPLMLNIRKANHRVHWKRFIDIYLWMLGKGSALDSLFVLTFSVVSSSRGVLLYNVRRAICSNFFFLIHARRDISRAPCRARLLVNRSARARISRRWKSRRRLHDAPVCNLVIDSPTFSALFPSCRSFFLSSTQAHRVPRKSGTFAEIALGVTYDLCFNLDESSRPASVYEQTVFWCRVM